MRLRLSLLAVPVAVFISGAVLLGVEIAASRVLAPYFGSSIYVWGALIGVVLTGLAIGYWLGGVLVDRWPRPVLLASAITLGGLLVLAVPFVDDEVMTQVVSRDLGPRAAPLVASVALFGPLSVVLAMVTPVAIRLRAFGLESIGRTSGSLFALSTAGSIVGVFLTAFFLIPAIGLERLLLLAAGLLILAAALVALTAHLWKALAFLLVLFAGALTLALTSGDTPSLNRAAPSYTPAYRVQGRLVGERPDLAAEGLEAVYQKDSQYHRITVADSADSRFLRFDRSFQSGMYLQRPFVPRFEYTTYMDLGLAYRPSPAKAALLIGLGGGSLQKELWRDFPELALTTVELDPAVRDVAYRFFALPRDERLKVVVDDGRRFLAGDDEQWDLIFIDAFYADAIPFHLTTLEFLELVKSRLTPAGVVTTNVIGALDGSRSRLLRALVKTYQASFDWVALHPVELGQDKDELRNVILVAGVGAQPTPAQLRARWAQVASAQAPDLDQAISARLPRTLATDDVPLLTDDYAPVDALLLFGD